MTRELLQPAIEALLLLSGMLLLAEAGSALARRRARRRKDDRPAESGVIAGAVFGLLGLLLAFEFSGAATRLQIRRDVSIHEINAIGTAWLRLDLVPPGEQAPLRDLFRRYVESRIRVRELMPDVEAARAEAGKSTALQLEIWAQAIRASRVSGSDAARLLLPALNEMIDVTNTGTVAALTRSPPMIVVLLGTVALLSAVLAGYSTAGLHRGRVTRLLLFTILTLTFYLIRDLDQPRAGAIRIGAADEVFLDLREQVSQTAPSSTPPP